MRVTWKLILSLSVVLLVALAVSACGGDDDNKGGSSTANATQTQSADGGGSSQTPVEGTGGGSSQTQKPTTTSGGNGSGDAIDPCTYLTKQDVATATSVDIADGKITSDSATKPECEWDSVDALDGVAIYLSVYGTGRSGDAEEDYSLFDPQSDAVDGMGDKAHWVSSLGVLEVLKDDHNMAIQVVDLKSGADEKAIALELGAKAAPHLP